MALDSPDYYPLLELAIEEPEIFGPEPQTFGFAALPEPFTLLDGLGRPHFFGPGLYPGLTIPGRSADFYSGASASEESPRFTIALEAFDAVNFQAIAMRFERVKVRIWWWRPGWDLTEAVLVWTGRLRDVEIDPDGGTFSGSAPPGTREIDVDFPPGFIGDEGRFPDAPDSSKPVPLPVVIGAVRNLPVFAIDDDSVEQATVGPPVVPAVNIRYLIAGHQIPTQTLIARSESGLLTGALTVAFDRDDRGNLFSYIAIANSAANNWSPSPSVYVGGGSTQLVRGQSAPGDAATNPEFIQGLGDALIFLLNTYAREEFFEVDRDRIYAAKAHLNAFRIGAWFNDRSQGVSFLRLLKSRFEGQFPVSFSFANGRFGWDYTGVPPLGGEPVAQIVWGSNAHDRSPLRRVSIDLLRTRFEVQYVGDGFAGGTSASVRRDWTNSNPAKACRDRWGINLETVIAAPDVSDEATARLLAEDQIMRLTSLRSRISYVVDEPRAATLPLFGRVVVTDETWGWVNEPFLIEGVNPVQPGRVSLALITERGQ